MADPVWSITTPTTATIVRNYPADELDTRKYLAAILAREHGFPETYYTGGKHLPGRCGVLFYGTAAAISALSSPPQYSAAYATDTCLPYYFDGSNWQAWDMVTKSTTQTISGAKTFSANTVFNGLVTFSNTVSFGVAPAGFLQNIVEDTTPQFGGDLDANDKKISKLKALDFADFSELTIDSGVITVTQACHTVDTAADASSDDLDTIAGGTTGMVIYLRAENDARTIVVKHNTGNIWNPLKSDLSLDDVRDAICLIYDGTKWIIIGGWDASGAEAAAGTYIEAGWINDNYPTGGSYGVAWPKFTATTSYAKMWEMKVSRAGTYTVKHSVWGFFQAIDYSQGSLLTEDVTVNANDLIQVYGAMDGSNRYLYTKIYVNGAAVGTQKTCYNTGMVGGSSDYYLRAFLLCSSNPTRPALLYSSVVA